MSNSDYQMTKNRSDLSQFLIHLTKDGTYEELVPKNGVTNVFEKKWTSVVAKISLVDMLSNKVMKACGPVGYFKLKVNEFRAFDQRTFFNGGADPKWLYSVCFSEAPLSELSNFYRSTKLKRNQYQKYGVAFYQEKLRQLGANPIFYVDSRKKDLLKVLNDSLKNSITANGADFIPMMYLIDSFGPPVRPGAQGHSDWRWEREWRKKECLKFEYTDLAFGICDQSEFIFFEKITSNQVTFIDPDWDTQTLKTYLSKKNPKLLELF